MYTARRERQRGQSLVMFAISLVAILAGVGLVLDSGGAWAQQRSQQKGADLSALAGAVAQANSTGGGNIRQAIIDAAVAAAVANGYPAAQVQVNMPPTQGKFAPGGSQGSANDCSSAAQTPCYVEVIVTKPRQNFFAGVVGQAQWEVAARSVSIGGIANTILSGASPIMFHEGALDGGETSQSYCIPQAAHCPPGPNAVPQDEHQFAWTTYCANGHPMCNVNAAEAMALASGGGHQFPVYLDMELGPLNAGIMTSVCHALRDAYPNGGDLLVAITRPDEDQTGPTGSSNLVGFWVFRLESVVCTPSMSITGYFTDDVTDTLPLTVTPGPGLGATTGIFVANIVE